MALQDRETWFTRFGLRWPLIQAPMAGVQGSALAIAVARAGALGSLPAALLSTEALVQELQRVRDAGVEHLNVNFFCHTMAPLQPHDEACWQARLADYDAAWRIDRQRPVNAPLRLPFGAEVCEAIAPFKPSMVSFHFGLPSPKLLHAVKAWGATVLASATTVDEARWLEAQGADLIVAQGVEAGGHRGMFLATDVGEQWGTLALLPQVVDAVRCPVLAAGGVADARAVRACMALGAAGVQVGTAFMLAPESTTSSLHRQALAGRLPGVDPKVSALTRLFSGRPARGLVNRLMRELGPMQADAPPFPHASTALAPLRSAAEAQGVADFTPLWSGQAGCGFEDQPAAHVVQALAQGF